MSVTPQSRPNHPAPSGAQAVFFLSADGRVEAANSVATALWQETSAQLRGRNFASLFVTEIVSRDAASAAAYWEAFLSTAAGQPIPQQLLRLDGSTLAVRVELDSDGTSPLGYFGYVQPTAAGDVVPRAVVGDELFSVLRDRSALGFFDLNFVKQSTFLSPSWRTALGYTEASLANSHGAWASLIHPDDTTAAPDKLAVRTMATGTRPFNVEFRMRHAHGHYVWVQCIGVQCFGPNGSLQRIVGVQLDIAERKELEESALAAEERLNLLSERGRVALFELDFVQHSAWLSPAFKNLAGFEEHEELTEPENFLRALPPEDTTGGLIPFFTQPKPGLTVYFDTLRLRHRNGTDLWVYAGIIRQFSRRRDLQRVLGFITPMPEEGGGGPAGLTGVDFLAVLAELREAVILLDRQGSVLLLNATAERLLDASAEQLVGRSGNEVFRPVHRASGAPAESPIDRALTTGSPTALTLEFVLDRGAGIDSLPVAYSCRAVLDANGVAMGAVLVFRDPAEMSLTPDELVRANRFEALGQLAGGIAHDFNNLLTTILGGVSLAKDNRDDSGLESSERACLAAKALSKQLLQFAKGGTGTRQVLRVAEFLGESVRFSAAGSSVNIELSAPNELGTVRADRGQLLQVFQNLILNAVQAMPGDAGNVWVTARNVTLLENQIAPLPAGAYIAIAVRDNGSGIATEHLARVFDPFFTTKKSGSGLGLATVHSIVKRHGGQIGLESELGVGTTFTVFLPSVEQAVPVEARAAPTLRYGTGRILFMDDDPEISRITEGMLLSLEYKVDLARSGEEAIQLYKRYLNIKRPYDVVIMDLNVIGGMGGEPCFKILRDLDPDVRAIVASGYDSEDMAKQFLEMGFCGYLTKPYRVSDIARILRAVLGK